MSNPYGKAILKWYEELKTIILGTANSVEVEHQMQVAQDELRAILGDGSIEDTLKQAEPLIEQVIPEIEFIYSAMKLELVFSEEGYRWQKGRSVALAAFDKGSGFNLLKREYLEKVDYNFGARQSRRYFIKPIIEQIVQEHLGITDRVSVKLYALYVKMHSRRKKTCKSDKRVVVVAKNPDDGTIIMVLLFR